RRGVVRRRLAPAGSGPLPSRRPLRRVGTPAAKPAEAGTPAASTDVTEDAAPKRTRRRATRTATSPAAAPAETAETAAAPAEAAETAAAPAVTAAPEPTAVAEGAEAAEAEEAAPRRTRRRASRRASAPAGAPSAADAVEGNAEEAKAPVTENPVAEPARASEATASETAAAEPARAADAPAETAADESAEEAGPRRRRRVVRRAASGFAEPAQPAKGARASKAASRATASAADGDSEPTSRPRRPAVALFQAPVFTEPQFQTPERAAAAAAAEAVGADEPQKTEESAPAEAQREEQTGGSRRRRRRRGAGDEPETQAPETAAADTSADEAEEADESAEDQADGDDQDESEGTGSRRRRRRGGRRRRRGESADSDGEGGEDAESEQGAAQDTEDSAEEDDEDSDDATDRDESGGGGSSSSRRRRRRRRRAGDSGTESEPSDDDPERTVVKVREPRPKAEPSDEVQSIKGSTRLEAKKQRRREGREQGRRRVPIITEAEFLARREAVERVMVVRQHGDRTQIGVLEDDVLVEHYVNKEQATSYVGNVYLGKVQNVLPSMEAAFIDIGKGRNAVLYAGEVNFEALGMAHGPRRIESALKSGQSVLVQVTKDPIGHKGARLTSQVSLPGRYLVYVPEGSMTGISRKLPDTERARLKTILKKIVPEDAGVIVRTAAEGASEDELRRDVERLQQQWEDIQKKAKSGNAPTLLYGEPDMTVRVVRDIFNEDFSKVVVSGDEAWSTIHGYVSHVAPDLAERLSKWTSEVDVFATYRIDEQLAKALDRKVWLPSGGSLVIDRTEAMVVVDVNTGKFTGQGGNLEETVTRNNLEAAEEIVRQLRLRDLGGIIVIDFIDMVLESNRDLVLRRLLECLGRDRTKHQVAEVTSLGLVQMTRKRVGQGLLESFSETCVHCNGRGVIVHMEQPTAAGGGGKRKKRARAGAAEQPHVHEAAVETAEQEAETEAEVGAEAAEPIALPEPSFEPDEELYGSAAEAEAAAGRGRSRRRASRRASAPAGSPRGEAAEPKAEQGRDRTRRGRGRAEQAEAEVPTAQDVTVEQEVARPVQPEPAAEAQAEPMAVEDPVVEAAQAAPVVEAASPGGSPPRDPRSLRTGSSSHAGRAELISLSGV
ncbi:Rne/Rng family ribonuclease, partial [Streptomyces massasporeus]|uniref:Rne/Rng family ribonuclease n=1 Tax=Streptomyces massasporeus TaxID=67324 RepID=UPI0033FAEBDC